MAKRKSKNNKNKNKNKNKQNKTKVVYRDRPQMSIGAQIGDGLQKWGTSIFKKITGMGDYKMGEQMSRIRKNSLFVDGKNQPPSFSNGMSTFVFEHSEYLGDIVSSSVAGGYNVQSYNVSPSDAQCFPWLSSIADNFQQYEVEGMIFRFESTSGESVASTNTALGNVMGLFSYDYADPLPTSKQAFLQYDGCVDARANESFLVGVECAKDSLPYNKLYLGTPGVGLDPRMNYKGKFVIASNGLPGTSVVIGELWCHYRVKLSIASLPNINSIGGQIDGNLMFTNTGATGALPYGAFLPFTGTVLKTTINLSFINSNAIQLTGLVPGLCYQISFYYFGVAGNTAFMNSSVVLTGATSIATFQSGGVLASSYTYYQHFQATQSNVTVAIAPTGLVNPCQIRITVFQFDSTVLNN